MLESRLSPAPGNFFGYALLAGIVLLDAGLLWLLIGEPVTILSFLWGLLLLVSLPAVAVVVYSTAGLPALRLSDPAGAVPPSHLSFISWPIWHDRLALMMWITAVSLNGLLFAYLCAIYSRLPALVPLHFNESGIADRVETPANLFMLPLVGLAIWLVNGLLGWLFYQWRGERPLAFILWGAAIVAQLAAWAALLGLLA